jgi:hypothetical protein
VHPAAKFLLVFLLAFVIGDRAGSALLYRLVSLSDDRFVKLYLGKLPADIVIIGNSRAADQFPPSLMANRLGVPVVNLGFGGFSMLMSEVLLRDYVERNGRPQLLVVEPTCLTVSPDEVGDMGLFTIFSERINQLVKAREPKIYYSQQAFRLFTYNNENFARVLYNVFRPREDRLHEGSITPELVRIVRERRSIRLTNHPDNELALDGVLRFAREEGIDVAIVASPYLREQLHNIANYKDWLAALERHAGGNVKLWDYAALFDEPHLFKDSVHLNTQGTLALLDAMLNSGVFERVQTKGARSSRPQPAGISAINRSAP